ncbi:MAG: type II toxin-antitoxin system VapC family toxin [Gammaproteobacteria bacterium]
MNFLLDTHAFLWWVNDAPELSTNANAYLAEPRNEVFFSLASVWEMAIKLSIGKLKLAEPLENFVIEQLQRNGFRQLGISFQHVIGVASLPFHHRDPFDRLIIAQALAERLPVLTADRTFDAYGIQRLW